MIHRAFAAFTFTLALTVLAHAPHAAIAQQPSAAPPSPPEPTITLAPQLTLDQLLDLAARSLGVRLEYDAKLLGSEPLSLRAPGPLPPAALWALTLRALEQRSLVLIAARDQTTLLITRREDAARLATPISFDALNTQWPASAKFAPTFAAITLELRHLTSAEAIEHIKPAKPVGPSASNSQVSLAAWPIISPIPGRRAITIADTLDRVRDYAALLQSLDVPEQQTTLLDVPVESGTAQQVLTTVNLLVSKQDKLLGHPLPGEVFANPSGQSLMILAPTRWHQTWRDLILQADRRQSVSIATYTPSFTAAKQVGVIIDQLIKTPGGKDDRIGVIIEEPTNTLVVTATAAGHARIAQFFERLEALPKESRRSIRTIAIRYRSVSELTSILNQLIAAGALDAISGAPQGQNASPRQAPSISPQRSPNQASPFSPAGTMRAAGDATLAAGLGPTMPIDATLLGTGIAPVGVAAGAAITLTSDEITNSIIALGEPRLLDELESLIATLDTQQPQILLEVVLITLSERDSLSLGIELQTVAQDAGTAIRLSSLFGLSTPVATSGAESLSPGFPAGLTGALLRAGDWSVVLRALQSVGSGKALSLPKVLVANNFRTQFNSVVQEPFGVSFTPGNSSSTNVTFGGTLDAGTTLSIKPQLSTSDAANRFIVLDYSISISSFGEQGRGGNLPPSRQVNTVQSLATLPDGAAVVVGGLESIASSQSGDQVPLLGDIPLLGEVFKNRSTTASQSRFFVLIRATSVNTVDQPGVMQSLSQAANEAASPQWSPTVPAPSQALPEDTQPSKTSNRDWTRTIGISP